MYTAIVKFSTEGRKKMPVGFAVCFKRGLVFARRITCIIFERLHVLQTILDLVLRLVGLVLFSVILCLLHHPINFGVRQLFFVCDGGLVVLVLGTVLFSTHLMCWARTAPLSLSPRVARGDLRICPRVVGTGLSVMGPWVPTLAVFFLHAHLARVSSSQDVFVTLVFIE